jgi:hypothetical protein
MKAGKKVIVIHVKNDVEKEEFMKEVQKLNLPAFIYVHGKLNTLKINIQGTKDEIRDAVYKINEIHRRVRSRLYANKKGLYEYVIDDIFREAGVSISAPILLKTLKLLNEVVQFEEGTLKTTLSWNEIVELVKRLGALLAQVTLQTTRQIREVVLPVAVAHDLDPEEILDIMVELGLAEYKEDKFKYELVKNKEQAMELLLKYLEGEEK